MASWWELKHSNWVETFNWQFFSLNILSTFVSGKSGDRFGRERREHCQHCQTSQVHPWQDLLWDRSSALLSLLVFPDITDVISTIALRLLKLIQNHQEHGQQTISRSAESSLRGWTIHSSVLHTRPIRAGWGHLVRSHSSKKRRMLFSPESPIQALSRSHTRF